MCGRIGLPVGSIPLRLTTTSRVTRSQRIRAGLKMASLTYAVIRLIVHRSMEHEPLSEARFYVLLALGEGPRHGYAILKDIENISQGRLTPSTGTLYGILQRFLELGWIRRAADPNPQQNLSERQAYALTATGRRVALTEARRLETLLSLSRRRFVTEEA